MDTKQLHPVFETTSSSMFHTLRQKIRTSLGQGECDDDDDVDVDDGNDSLMFLGHHQLITNAMQ